MYLIILLLMNIWVVSNYLPPQTILQIASLCLYARDFSRERLRVELPNHLAGCSTCSVGGCMFMPTRLPTLAVWMLICHEWYRCSFPFVLIERWNVFSSGFWALRVVFLICTLFLFLAALWLFFISLFQRLSFVRDPWLMASGLSSVA